MSSEMIYTILINIAIIFVELERKWFGYDKSVKNRSLKFVTISRCREA